MGDTTSSKSINNRNIGNATATMDLTIHHQGTPYTVHLTPDATLQDLTTDLVKIVNIPTENQKLLIAPKPGMQRAPFPPTRLDTILQRDSPRFKITLLGTPAKEIEALHQTGEDIKRKIEAREASRAAASTANRAASSRRMRAGRKHSSNIYTFHRLLPLTYLPNPDRSLNFLERLRGDPGIRAAMERHRFSVPLLTEMNPVEHTTSHSRTLGLNRNGGEAIELRLRTDAYDGYRDYRTIRKTLCHELAHCVHGDHNREFWDLTKLLEKEVERDDWLGGGYRLGQEEFYNPPDWEERKDVGDVDEGGWTGGEFVLGGLREDSVGSAGSSAGGEQKPSGVESRREILARAAEERMRREKEGN